ncbi:MAG: fimbrillin family protein, partial [Prevotella sp.]|nr:fimbrillin family protein [Prevotella sp.]
KASPATGSQLTNFIVSAFWSEGDWDTGTRRLFDAQNVYKTEGGDWDYRPKKIWPSTGSVAFYAYAPAGSPNTDGLSGKGSSTDQVPEITYTVPDSPADQEDFMLAVKSYDTGDLSGAVSLRFRHVLSYVTVSVQNAYNENIRVSKLELRNIHKAGSLKLEEDDGTGAASNGIPAGETGFRYDDSGQVTLWTTTDNINHDAAANKIAFALEGAGGVTVYEGATVSLTGNTNGLFVLPQELEDDGNDALDDGETYIHVEYATYSEPSVTLTENIRLDLAAFEAGRRYTVVTSLFDPDHDPAAVNVWAASNIYFKPDVQVAGDGDGIGDGDVGTLTFAESKADGTTFGGKEGYQGVYFKWSSLIGVSTNTSGTDYDNDNVYLFIPNTDTGKYHKYKVGNVTAARDDIVDAYLGKAGGNGWNNIPYENNNLTAGRETNALSGISPENYTGDICKYLSDKRSTNGSGLTKTWQTPVSDMFAGGYPDTFPYYADDGSEWDAFEGWSGFSGTDENGASQTTNAFVVYTLPTKETVFFPASGYRYPDGRVSSVGSYGCYWSSSADYAPNAYGIGFSSVSVNPLGSNLRAYGQSIRCVVARE